jgi:drug/metabolite transporter (DMT)-like permease
VVLLTVLCLIWGGNMVSIKVSNQGVAPILAAAIRSLVASLLLWLYALALRERVFLPRGFVKHGTALGLLFGMEVLFLFWGIKFTDASRAVIFLYTQPLWTLLLAHLFLHDERLGLSKSAGVIIALVGLCLVFGSRPVELAPSHWVGDLMEVAAGFLWAATTVYIKRFIGNTSITHYQTLFSQLFYSIPVLVLGSLLFEWGLPVSLSGPVIAALFYQSVIGAFASYLAWFWLLHRFQAGPLSSFTFLAPIFGVILSGIFLHEQLTAFLGIGLVMVTGGIYLVNRA